MPGATGRAPHALACLAPVDLGHNTDYFRVPCRSCAGVVDQLSPQTCATCRGDNTAHHRRILKVPSHRPCAACLSVPGGIGRTPHASACLAPANLCGPLAARRLPSQAWRHGPRAACLPRPTAGNWPRAACLSMPGASEPPRARTVNSYALCGFHPLAIAQSSGGGD